MTSLKKKIIKTFTSTCVITLIFSCNNTEAINNTNHLEGIGIVSLATENETETKLLQDGLDSFNNEKYSDAVGYFKKVVESDPTSAIGYAYLAQSMYLENQTSGHPIYKPEILQYDNKAISLDNKNPLFYCFRALHEPMYNTVENDLQKAIELDSKFAYAYYCKGIVRERMDDHKAAINMFTRAINIGPAEEMWYIDRGDAYYAMEDYTKAMADYNTALKMNPDDAYIHYSIGDIYYSLGNYQSAMNEYNKTLSIDPAYANAYYSRGMIFFKEKNYYKTISECTKAITLDSGCADAYYWRGWANLNLHEYRAAINDFTQAIKQSDDDDNDIKAGSYQGRAYAYKAIGDYELYKRNVEMYNKYNE